MQIIENVIVYNETKRANMVAKSKVKELVPILYLGGEIFGLNPKRNFKACLRYVKNAVENN